MIYLIDSSIYIFRAWQTLPPSITNSHGEQANAVHGFTDTLAHILAEKQPDYIACAFDKSSGTGERYSIYPDYKANREPPPPELEIQFDRCMQVATAMGVPVFSSTQVEADDIIGSFAKLAHQREQKVTIISADKDLAQFIGEGDCYWNLTRKEQYDYRQLTKRFKVLPEQIADMLALCGDKVDNVPGIPGVGPTTAARLLRKWDTLEGVIDNQERIAKMHFRGAPRVANLVAEHVDTIRLARQLTGLIVDKSLPGSLNALKRQLPSNMSVAKKLIDAGVSEQRAHKLALRIEPANKPSTQAASTQSASNKCK